MTAAKVMDVIARLPGGAGQAADAVSTYTHVPRYKWSKSWSTIEDPVVRFFLNEMCIVTLFAGLVWERQFEKVLLGLGWETVPHWECLFVHRKEELLLSVYVDDINMADIKQNMAPMWKTLMRNVHLGEPTSFLDHVYLGCTQRDCKPNETIIERY